MTQCECFIQNGLGPRCSRNAKKDSNFCFQHQNCLYPLSSRTGSTSASTNSLSSTQSTVIQNPPIVPPQPPKAKTKLQRPIPIPTVRMRSRPTTSSNKLDNQNRVIATSFERVGVLALPQNRAIATSSTKEAVEKRSPKASEVVEKRSPKEVTSKKTLEEREDLEDWEDWGPHSITLSTSVPIQVPSSTKDVKVNLGLIENMMESYPPWTSSYYVENPNFVDIGNYRFHYPSKTSEYGYTILVVPTEDLFTHEKWINPYYLAGSSNMFRYAARCAGMFYKGYHYVSSTFPHIKLQNFLHKAYTNLDTLKEYKTNANVSVNMANPLTSHCDKILVAIDEAKIYDDPTFNTMNRISCGLYSLIFRRDPDMIIPKGDLSTRPIRLDLLEGEEKRFYEYMFNTIMNSKSEDIYTVEEKDYKKIVQMLASLLEANFAVVEETRKFLFFNAFQIGEAVFNMSVYSVIIVSKQDIYKRFKVIYSSYYYGNPKDIEHSKKNYTSIIAIQVDDDDVNRLGLPKVIVAPGAYACKIIEYHEQSTFVNCGYIDNKYCFMGHAISGLWPSKKG